MELAAEFFDAEEPVLQFLLERPPDVDDVVSKESDDEREKRPLLTMNSMTDEHFRSSFRMAKGFCNNK